MRPVDGWASFRRGVGRETSMASGKVLARKNDNETELVIMRIFDAPRELVFKVRTFEENFGGLMQGFNGT